MVFGVCGGLAEYFDLDAVFVRLAFVLTVLAGGAGVLAYLILAIVMPDEPAPDFVGAGGPGGHAEPPASESWVDILGATSQHVVAPVHPSEEQRARRRRRNQEFAGLVLVGLGLILVAGNLGWFYWFHWGAIWPLILVALGVAILVGRGRAA
jgi:phage shock protein C